MSLSCQIFWAVIAFILVIVFFLVSCFPLNNNESSGDISKDKRKIDWKQSLRCLLIFPCMLSASISLFLISNVVMTYFKKKGKVAESILSYEETFNLIPVYITLVVTIMIAIIQIIIQFRLREKDKEEEERIRKKDKEEEERIRKKDKEEEERIRKKDKEEEERIRKKDKEEEERIRKKDKEEEERIRKKDKEEEERIRKKDKEEARIQNEHNKRLREIDIKSRLSEQFSKSLKQYMYFKEIAELKCVGDDEFEFLLELKNKTIPTYYSVEQFKLKKIEYRNEEIVVKDFGFDKESTRLSIKISEGTVIFREIIENAILGDKQELKVTMDAKFIDNSFKIFRDSEDDTGIAENNTASMEIIVVFYTTNQITSNNGLQLEANFNLKCC